MPPFQYLVLIPTLSQYVDKKKKPLPEQGASPKEKNHAKEKPTDPPGIEPGTRWLTATCSTD